MDRAEIPSAKMTHWLLLSISLTWVKGRVFNMKILLKTMEGICEINAEKE